MMLSGTSLMETSLLKVHLWHGPGIPNTFPSGTGFPSDPSSCWRTRSGPRPASWFGKGCRCRTSPRRLALRSAWVAGLCRQYLRPFFTACKFTQPDGSPLAVGVVPTHHHSQYRTKFPQDVLARISSWTRSGVFLLMKGRLAMMMTGWMLNQPKMMLWSSDRFSVTGNGGKNSGYWLRCFFDRSPKSSRSLRTSAAVRCTSWSLDPESVMMGCRVYVQAHGQRLGLGGAEMMFEAKYLLTHGDDVCRSSSSNSTDAESACMLHL